MLHKVFPGIEVSRDFKGMQRFCCMQQFLNPRSQVSTDMSCRKCLYIYVKMEVLRFSARMAWNMLKYNVT